MTEPTIPERIRQEALTREGRRALRQRSYLLPDSGGEVTRVLVDVIESLDKPHRITFDNDGWFIHHAIACREEGTLGDCDYHDAVRAVGDSYLRTAGLFGTYLLVFDEDGEIMFEPEPEEGS